MTKIIKLFLITTVFMIFSLPCVFAQVEGLVMDKTRTKMGHDFFEIFYLNLERVPGIENFNIVVEEFVDPQYGSRVSVSINETVVYQNFVSSRYDDIEEKAKEADEVVNYFLLNWRMYQQFLDEEGKIR